MIQVTKIGNLLFFNFMPVSKMNSQLILGLKDLLFRIIILFVLSLSVIQAQAASIETNVSQRQVAVGDVFTVSIEVSFQGNAKPEISVFEIPKNPKISFLRQSEGYSYQTTITNGSMVSKKIVTLNMIFHAKDPGLVKVPLVKLKINSKVFAAKGFDIEILEKGKSPIQTNPRNRSNDPLSGMEGLLKEFFGARDANIFGSPNANSSNLDFFVDVETSKMNPYYSEQFIANWYLYTNGRVTDIDTLKYPALEGFWKDEISLATSLTPEPVERNGKVYTRYLLASYALTPIVNDQAFIDPYEVKCQLIGGIFSFGAKEMIRKSDEILIKVKPLPKLKPGNFTGAVGDFQVTSYVQDHVFKVGQPFTYMIRVSGQGQLKFMELPELGLDSELFEIYDTTEEGQFSPPLKFTKTYKLLVVPKKEGSLEIPSSSFSFFDPEQSKFYGIKTKPIQIKVGKGDEVVQDIVAAYDSDKETVFTPELYSQLTVPTPFAFQVSNWVSYFICALTFLMSLGCMIFKFYGNQITYDFDKDLKNRFDNLEALIEENKWREASTLAVNIVYFYANAKSKKKPRSQKLEDILQVLPLGLRRNIESSLGELNRDLQKYSFAPDELLKNSDVKAKVLEKTLALKDLLERSSINEFKS